MVPLFGEGAEAVEIDRYRDLLAAVRMVADADGPNVAELAAKLQEAAPVV